MRSLAVASAVITAAVLLTACSTNEAKSYVPKASDLCCHGNWEILALGEDKEEGACVAWQEALFPDPRACWNRLYVNTKVRRGEPEDLQVLLAVLESEAKAQRWLSSYTPSGGYDPSEYTEMFDPIVGDGARVWEFSSTDPLSWGTEAAFYRDNLAVVLFAGKGTAEQREIMLESVDEAILDRIIGYK